MGATNRNSVQGAIELGLIQLRPANEPRLQLSSRTDKGVHALSSTATVDLQQRYNVKTTYFPPKYITTRLNTYFDLAKIDISYKENELHNSMGNFGSELCVKLAT